MSIDAKLELFIRHTAELRGELIEDGDEVTAMVYALAAAYIAECAAQEPGWEKVANLLGEAAVSMLARSEAVNLDEAINDILGSAEQNG